MKKFLLVTTTLAALATPAFAANFTQTAFVDIAHAPITLNPQSNMSFGTLTKPASGVASYTVNADHTTVAVNTIQLAPDGQVSPATFKLNSDTGSSLHMTITDVTATAGLTLDGFGIAYDGTSYSGGDVGGLIGGENKSLAIGARLNVASGASYGNSQQVNFNITVTYE